MKNKLTQLEARLQALIEVHLVSLLPGRKIEDLVAQQLASVMKANLVTLQDESRIAPNVYTLIVHPDSVSTWQDAELLATLISVLETAGTEAGLAFDSLPTISITADPGMQPDQVQVVASHKMEALADTKGVTAQSESEGEEALGHNLPANAFLIIEGAKVFPLQQSVVNIGRRLDNQLVIDDPRVSRSHAQLRAIKGRYVLFDLDSTGGTFVNGQRTSQTALYPGDVISLAGVALIFGQDNPPPRPDLADTSPLQPSSGERPTAILSKDKVTRDK